MDEHGNMYAGLIDGRVIKIGASPEIGKGNVETLFDGVIEDADTTDGSVHGRPMGIYNFLIKVCF